MQLSDTVGNIPLVGPAYIRRLERLDIETVGDLLHHIPRRYKDFSKTVSIANLKIGEAATIKAQVKSAVNQYTKTGKQMQIIKVEDNSGAIEVLWFNQKYLLSTFKIGTNVFLSGEVSWFGRKKALVSPEYEVQKPHKTGVHTGRLVPVYPETKGVSSKWLRSRIAFVFPDVIEEFDEFLPGQILTKNKLMRYASAIRKVHFPNDVGDIQAGKRRLAFNELLFLQINASRRAQKWSEMKQAHELTVTEKKLTQFTDKLPFTLTLSQAKSIREIYDDLAKPVPMNRLLEGDVGSGKTVVAAAACFAAFVNNKQSVVMAPTQILAGQHFKTLQEILQPFGVKVRLVTGSTSKKNKERSDVTVGTHALISNRVHFQNAAVVVIDEQHRFGVMQRAKLIKKSGKKIIAPDVLTMTATPIPRTVALTAFADLGLSTLDELPMGRKKITTWIVPNHKRNNSYGWIEKQIDTERIQVFIVCPLIEQSETQLLQYVKAAKVEYKEIKKAFPSREVGLLHGKLSTKEKERVLQLFKSGKIDILVSTPIIEVGIDIPNATIIVVEAADRFGLAQLHQLRGRVGRGKKKSYCLLFTENTSEKVKKRLSALKESKSGFELAELDLKLRGPGEIFGTKQSGFPELKIADWTDFELIKQTKDLAANFMKNPEDYQKLWSFLQNKQRVAN